MLFFLLWKGYHMSLLTETATWHPLPKWLMVPPALLPPSQRKNLLFWYPSPSHPYPPEVTQAPKDDQKMTTFCNFPRTQRQPASGGLRRLQPSWGLPSRPHMSWQVDKLWIQMLHSQTCIWTYIFLYSSIQGKYFLTFAFTFFFVLFKDVIVNKLL